MGFLFTVLWADFQSIFQTSPLLPVTLDPLTCPASQPLSLKPPPPPPGHQELHAPTPSSRSLAPEGLRALGPLSHLVLRPGLCLCPKFWVPCSPRGSCFCPSGWAGTGPARRGLDEPVPGDPSPLSLLSFSHSALLSLK